MTTLSSQQGSLKVCDFMICRHCDSALKGNWVCQECGSALEILDGLAVSIGPLRGRNRISANFYNSDQWQRFRPWEELFLWFQGLGVTAARRQVLRHLPSTRQGNVLEVGIGDGENVERIPETWRLFGVDLAQRPLTRCLQRHPKLANRLILAEAEALPFVDASFDAVFSMGGANYFRDPEAALLEMKRVVKPGGAVIAADEIPDLVKFAPGHALGLEKLDRFGLRLMGLDPEFIAMVFDVKDRVESAAERVWPSHRRFPIWSRLGYCLVDFREE